MTARILHGVAVAEAVRAEVKRDVEALKARGVTPGLAVVLVGENPASTVYVGRKREAALDAGIEARVVHLPADVPQAKLEQVIEELNADPGVHGMIVQLPLPRHIDARAVLWRIRPEKDVDCLHPMNVGRLTAGDLDGFHPATPAGVLELLLRCGYSPEGMRVTIVGRSNIVGRPLSILLSHNWRGGNATVTLAHTRTRELDAVTAEADILVAASGKPNLVTGDMVKAGAVVVDVGVNRVEDLSAPKGYRLVGDVAFEEVQEVAAAITPVPGGVGPMTVAMLLRNVVKAASGAVKLR
ncbi:MAG: bifunctional 5,10-methylenetetrahydrofolate dehydrogenase/5,10-methenyltetrahydrofolate cyclohydrolase [Gemmatimonadetes bacterium]|nr:bifunctional 5,10-methylenetetrahydrofolate dehydrogenase/5,10-methenyltetrahydrofolate cyclohydrolase [Gemmatimonadota bacterium]